MKGIKSNLDVTTPVQVVQKKEPAIKEIKSVQDRPYLEVEDQYIKHKSNGTESLVTSALERLFGLFVSAYAILVKPSQWFESSLRSFNNKGLVDTVDFSKAFEKVYEEETIGSKQEDEKQKLINLVQLCQERSGDIGRIASTITGKTAG